MTSEPRAAAPGGATVVLRGLTRRCPWCGSGGLFRRWFVMARRCPRCGFRLDQGDAAFLGAMALNYAVAGILFVAQLVVWLVATVPDVPVGALLVSSLVVTGAAILGFYPFSKTLWASIDVLLHRMDRADRAMHDAGRRSTDVVDQS